MMIANRGHLLSADGVDLTATGKWWWDESTDSPGDAELVKWNFAVPLRHGEVFVPNPPRAALPFTISMVVHGATTAEVEENLRALRRVLSRQDRLVLLRRRLAGGPLLRARAHRTGDVRASWEGVGRTLLRAEFAMSIPAGVWTEDAQTEFPLSSGENTIPALADAVGDTTEISMTFAGRGDDTRVTVTDVNTGTQMEFAAPLATTQTATFSQAVGGGWTTRIGTGPFDASSTWVSPGGLRFSGGPIRLEVAPSYSAPVQVTVRRSM